MEKAQSHPSRGAWIEIKCIAELQEKVTVAPLTGCVDRNMSAADKAKLDTMSHPARGAWIEISRGGKMYCFRTSHPSRGAWIEILIWFYIIYYSTVAPLTGCVDRNNVSIDYLLCNSKSHPSRGAWIEIPLGVSIYARAVVAPLTGCVDRNTITETDYIEEIGRTTHGVRG